jgi:hypothetical protein
MLIATFQLLSRGASERTAAIRKSGLSDGMPTGNSVSALLPIMAVLAIACLIIGILLPVLPLHVHCGLGLSTFVVGVVTGSQFLASLLSRVWAGQFADHRGSKRAVILGLLAAVVSGTLCLVSLAFKSMPWISVSVLFAGRALLGAVESFIITGAATWGSDVRQGSSKGEAKRRFTSEMLHYQKSLDVLCEGSNGPGAVMVQGVSTSNSERSHATQHERW